MTCLATETMLARQLNPWEVKSLPEALRLPFPSIRPEWTWVVDSPAIGGVCAILYAGDLHGMAYLARLAALPTAPPSALTLLFRQAFSDLRSRGYSTIMCWLSISQCTEVKLARIIQRLGGGLAPESGWFAAARIDGRRW